MKPRKSHRPDPVDRMLAGVLLLIAALLLGCGGIKQDYDARIAEGRALRALGYIE